MSMHPLYGMYPDEYPSVLDLSRSRRGDSVETRKTPSPAYSATSSREAGSPQTSQSYMKYNGNMDLDLRRSDSIKTEDYMANNYRTEIREDSVSPFMLKAAAYQQPQILLTPAQLTPLTSPELRSPEPVSFDNKSVRPFKAYPRDPLALAAGFTATADSTIDMNSTEKYCAFRERMLQQIRASNGGRATISNPKMRRCPTVTSSAGSPNPNEQSDSTKDSAYYERRKKNNAAAKKSRDRRRVKEDEIAIRAAFLERENIELKFELAAIRKQLAMSASKVQHVQC
ncbi:protein giant-like [Ctenocephalides felis]|uniref:protein giant-like n=1 Tax=Ctenocephalides felis TaxID=7515 RepID=UPI000E6E3FF3|nr:protein giant-like [Ctenocephalides felis]